MQTDVVQKYLKDQYGMDVPVKDFSDKNYVYDSIAHDRNLTFFIEWKSRYFTTGINDGFMRENDILIELVQSLPYFNRNQVCNNKKINNLYSPYKVNIAIGWFYKCNADRLIFFRFLDERIYDIIDIDFRKFKNWFMNNVNKVRLQYSDKTTGTINAVVKLKDIPQIFYHHMILNAREQKVSV